jgi:hypothetical protein
MFETSILSVINYCDSDENLYPQVETMLIGLLCDLDIKKSSIPLAVRTEDLAGRMTGDGSGAKKSLSDISKGVRTYCLNVILIAQKRLLITI